MHPNSILIETLLTAAQREGADTESRCRALFEQWTALDELRQAFRGETARDGLTEPGFSTLVTLLAREPALLSLSDLVGINELPATQTRQTVTRLQMAQLIQLGRNAPKGRTSSLQLTPAGRRRALEAVQRYLARIARVTATLDDHELAMTREIAGKLRAEAVQLRRETSRAVA